MEYVKHDTWFYREVNGNEYRGKYITHGFSYATMVVQIRIDYKVKKYLFFGKDIDSHYWKTIVSNSRNVNIGNPIERTNFYDVERTRHHMDLCIQEQKTHTERI